MRQLFLVVLLLNIAFYYWQNKQAELPQSTVESSVDSTLPSNVEPILLLSEVDQSDTRNRDSGQQVSTPPAHAETKSPLPPPRQQARQADNQPLPKTCYLLGPFDQDSWLQQIAMLLEARNLNVRRYRGAERVADTYWIYIPLASQSAAQKTLGEVRNNGILDSALVRLGDNRYAISMGLYRHRESADRRLEHLKSLGYAAELKERYKNKHGNWLLIEQQVDSEIIDVLQRELAKKPEVAIRARPCPSLRQGDSAS